jgi:hypothetical protein
MRKTIIFLKEIVLFLKEVSLFLILTPVLIIGAILPGVILTILVFTVFFSDTLSIESLIDYDLGYWSKLETLIVNLSFWGFSYLFYKHCRFWRENVVKRLFTQILDSSSRPNQYDD